MQKKISIRSLAIKSLIKWEDGHIYAESLIQNAAQRYNLSQPNRNLLNSILINCIRHLNLLDYWISELKDGKLDAETRNTLRVGLCQLYIIKLPSHAAVNETVNSAQKHTKKLINALLRKSQREFETLEEKTKFQPIHIRHSHPEWLTKKWCVQFGEENTEELLKWNQQSSKTTFRLNNLKNDSHQLLSDTSVEFQSLPDYPDFFVSEGLPPKAWIDDGLIYIQDPATSHAVELLSPMPGETILDACAAPGGKSSQIAAHMQNSGTLYCTDSNEKRLPRLEQNLERLGISIANIQTWDWLDPAPEKYHATFDAILLDVPCSNTGVLARRIDARWRITPESIEELTKIQLQILKNAIPCLKPEGRIVYSTCSIDHSENSEVIQKFIAAHPQFKLEKETQILPFKEKTDGAYSALLKRN